MIVSPTRKTSPLCLEQLYCDTCNEFKLYVYLAVFRGILVGIGDSLEEAKRMLEATGLEKIVLWYHDLFHKYRSEHDGKNQLDRFLRDVVQWFAEPEKRRSVSFWLNSHYLKEAESPLDAIKRFLADEKALGDQEGLLF